MQLLPRNKKNTDFRQRLNRPDTIVSDGSWKYIPGPYLRMASLRRNAIDGVPLHTRDWIWRVVTGNVITHEKRQHLHRVLWFPHRLWFCQKYILQQHLSLWSRPFSSANSLNSKITMVGLDLVKASNAQLKELGPNLVALFGKLSNHPRGHSH